MSLSVSCVKNWILEDPLLDYLNLYGNPDEKDTFAFPECNFTTYIMNKGVEYERRIYDHINKHRDTYSMQIIDRKHFYKQTQDAFRENIDIICQPFLKDYNYRIFNKYQIYGFPDIIIKKQAFIHLFKPCAWIVSITDDSYIVIDVKYSSFTFSEESELMPKRHYDTFVECQIMLYQHLINAQKIQNVKYACIVPKQEVNDGQKLNVLWIDMNKQTHNYKHCEKAFLWNTYVNTPYFSKYTLNELITGQDRVQLMPNLNNNMDYPWSSYKNKLARQYGEISLFSGVGSVLRKQLHTLKIYTVDSFRSSPLNVIEDPLVNCVKDMTRILIQSFDKHTFLKDPCIVQNHLRMYIDIETCYVFEQSREKIVMICCGYMKDGKWIVYYFTNIKEWILFMDNFKQYTVVHFSSAEKKVLQQLSYDVLTEDLYVKIKELYRTNKLRIEGLTSFSIKDIMKRLYESKCIEVNPYESCRIKSGMEVLTIYNWMFENEVMDENIIKEVEKYNEADVKSLYLIDRFLSSTILKN